LDQKERTTTQSPRSSLPAITIMARLTDLPVELLAQVMCDCDNIKSVVQLSSTFKSVRQVWHDNTLKITLAVMSFTKSELIDFLALSKIEASSSERQVSHASLK
jgi:hypothetical protein